MSELNCNETPAAKRTLTISKNLRRRCNVIKVTENVIFSIKFTVGNKVIATAVTRALSKSVNLYQFEQLLKVLCHNHLEGSFSVVNFYLDEDIKLDVMDDSITFKFVLPLSRNSDRKRRKTLDLRKLDFNKKLQFTLKDLTKFNCMEYLINLECRIVNYNEELVNYILTILDISKKVSNLEYN